MQEDKDIIQSKERRVKKSKISPEIKAFIDTYLKAKKVPSYAILKKIIAKKFGVKISKASISKRAKALKIKFRPGRKRIFPLGKRPARSIFLDCAGAFFLKGAEQDLGLLAAINQLFRASTESAQAKKILKLAQQINALLLYAPIFGLKNREDFMRYNQQGLLYLIGQKSMPKVGAIEQYLHFLNNRELLVLTTKEVTKLCSEALMLGIDFSDQTFYLDAQCRTVWPNPKIPRFFSTTLHKAKGYVEKIFLAPSAQRPLILQITPGYTFLPPEMFSLIECLEQAKEKSISNLVITGKSSETLEIFRNLRPPGRCYFIVPLGPWQYAQLVGSKIIQDFRQYYIGPKKELMQVAEAKVNLFNPQLKKNIKVRAALVRRKEERLALITNISPRQQRYIRKIAELYFSRWPQEKMKTYYDLLEEAHEDVLARSRSTTGLTPLVVESYDQRPTEMFKLFMEHLNHYSLSHFFPSEYEAESFTSMCEKFYHQSGYLKIRRNCWEVILRSFASKQLQTSAEFACRRFNQSDIEFPALKKLKVYLQ